MNLTQIYEKLTQVAEAINQMKSNSRRVEELETATSVVDGSQIALNEKQPDGSYILKNYLFQPSEGSQYHSLHPIELFDGVAVKIDLPVNSDLEKIRINQSGKVAFYADENCTQLIFDNDNLDGTYSTRLRIDRHEDTWARAEGSNNEIVPIIFEY